MPDPSTPLQEWIDDSAATDKKSRRQRPEDYVWPRWWFQPVVIGSTLALLAMLIGVAQTSVFAGAVAALMGVLIGLTMTLLAHAWAVAIVFSESPKRGLWFAIFPPYMVYYAILRWNWMAQPTVLFVSGLIIIGGAIYVAGSIGP